MIRILWVVGLAGGLGIMLRSSGVVAQEPVWWQTGGPLGGGVWALAVTPEGTLFASATGGVFRSADEGATWGPITPDFPVPVLALAGTADGTLFAGTDGGGSSGVSQRSRLWRRGKAWQPPAGRPVLPVRADHRGVVPDAQGQRGQRGGDRLCCLGASAGRDHDRVDPVPVRLADRRD